MSTRAKPEVPKVVVAPDLMPTSSIRIPFPTLRARLEQYLGQPRVTRKTSVDRAPTLYELKRKRLSFEDELRWREMVEQEFIDQLLRRIVKGEDPRVVFKSERARRGRAKDGALEQAMAAECMRICHEHELRPAAVIAIVADAFETSDGTVTRACRKWGAFEGTPEERMPFILSYIAALRASKRIS